MRVVYATEDLDTQGLPSIFLAGPSPRNGGWSWRPEALVLLGELGYDGVVYDPERREGWGDDYDDQVNWETAALARADAVVFWVPRDLSTLPGFTTNVEFGLWVARSNVFYGRPPGSAKNRYLDATAQRHGRHISTELVDVLSAAVSYVSTPRALGQEATDVSLAIANAPGFSDWYGSLVDHGHGALGIDVFLTAPYDRSPV